MSRLSSDPLFQGLTRPTMILGVSYMFFVVNAIICLVTFVNTQSFALVVPAAIIAHTTGYLICLKEPRAIEMMMVKVKKGYRCMNRHYHGYTNSYDLY
jgi:type IV secretion system protein VirB3